MSRSLKRDTENHSDWSDGPKRRTSGEVSRSLKREELRLFLSIQNAKRSGEVSRSLKLLAKHDILEISCVRAKRSGEVSRSLKRLPCAEPQACPLMREEERRSESLIETQSC